MVPTGVVEGDARPAPGAGRTTSASDGKEGKSLRSQSGKAQRGAGAGGAHVDGESPGGDAMEAERAGQRRRRRRRRRQQKTKEVPLDNLTRIKRRVKYLLMKMRVEQNLIDAYSGEGWKGQSREKIRPEQELQRAEAQILHSKLAIRDAIHELDNLGLEGSLDENAFDAEGRIYHEEIFCAKCKSQEALPDNDIILCDGACNRGFHQFCLNPPLATEEIPPGDEGWLCPVCECKMESIDVINAYLGTTFEVENSWEDLFAAEAVAAAGGETKNGAGGDWPSTDSEDDDYDPEGLEKRPNSESESESKEDGENRDSSDPESEFKGHEAYSGPSSDKDGEEPGSTAKLREDSRKGKHSNSNKVCDEDESGSGKSSSSEDSDVSLVDEFKTQDGESNLDLGLRGSQAEESASDEEAMIIAGKRHRKAVDYKKLHDEMFGLTELDENFVSEDEDWGPKRQRRRTDPDASSRPRPSRVRRRRARASNGNASNGVDADRSPGFQSNPPSGSPGDGGVSITGEEGGKRIWRRLPDTAVEALRRVVEVNQLPSKSVKEDLASKLGLTFSQVHGWFKNQRHQALRKGLVASSSKGVSTSNGVEVSVSESLAAPEIRTLMTENNTQANTYLTEKLDEVQLRLLELKQTLEVFARTTAAVDTEDKSGEVENNFGNGGIGLPANGKRVVYVPVAEVRERPSAGTHTSAC